MKIENWKKNILILSKRDIKVWKRTYSLEIWILCFRDELKRNPVKLISQFDVRGVLDFTGYGSWRHSENIIRYITKCIGLCKPYQLFTTSEFIFSYNLLMKFLYVAISEFFLECCRIRGGSVRKIQNRFYPHRVNLKLRGNK